MNTHQNLSGLQRPQHGGALILMVLILVLGVAAVMMSSISVLNNRPAVVLDPVTKQGLIAAKEGLITWAAMRGISGGAMGVGTEAPPGMLPYPDRHLDGNYDGTSDCVDGVLLASNAYRLGKLPVFGEPNPIPNQLCRSGSGGPDTGLQILDARDLVRETIWFEASRNLLDDFTGTGAYDTLSSKVLATPPGTPGNWLTVCDQKGNLLSNEVAFVVIAPGSVLPGQSRAGAAAASNFLDAFPLPAAGTSPCNNPAESNSDTNLVFITNNGLSPQFNDQLLYVTRQEFFTRVTTALAKNIANQLATYYVNSGLNKFPFPAALGPNTGDCVATTPPGQWGSLPVSCASFPNTPPFMADSLDSDGWYGAIRYKVDASRQKATINFELCAIDYTYERVGLNYVFSHSASKC